MNEICGGAIIPQSVCGGYCYSMLMPRGSIDPSRRERAARERGNRFQTAKPRKRVYLSSFLRRGGVARRNRLWNAMSPDPSCIVQIVPTCPACNLWNKSMGSRRKKRAVRRAERRKREKEGGGEGKRKNEKKRKR